MGLECLLKVPHAVEHLLFGRTSEEDAQVRIYWRRHPVKKFAYSSASLITTAAVILAAAITYNTLAYNHTEQAAPRVQYELEHDSAGLLNAKKMDAGYGRIPDK